MGGTVLTVQLLSVWRRSALVAPDRLLLLDTAQLTLRNEPAFSADRAENTALCNLLAEAFQQLILRLVGTQIHTCQLIHLLSLFALRSSAKHALPAAISDYPNNTITGQGLTTKKPGGVHGRSRA